MMSLYRVTDQNEPYTGLVVRWTGSSQRSRAKYGSQTSS